MNLAIGHSEKDRKLTNSQSTVWSNLRNYILFVHTNLPLQWIPPSAAPASWLRKASDLGTHVFFSKWTQNAKMQLNLWQLLKKNVFFPFKRKQKITKSDFLHFQFSVSDYLGRFFCFFILINTCRVVDIPAAVTTFLVSRKVIEKIRENVRYLQSRSGSACFWTSRTGSGSFPFLK